MMATAEDYASWIVKNADKKGTPDFELVARAYADARKNAAPVQGYDPTEGMTTFEKAAAGAGKAMVDIGRGAGQMLGLVSREDVAEARRRDAPLMGTTAGTVGNVAGNIAMMVPTAFVPGSATILGGAAIGAGTGLLQPSTSTGETLQNVVLGGVAAPVATIAGRGLAAGYQGVKSAADVFSKAGQNRIAADTLRAAATNPIEAMANMRAARELVPGSQPTVAQVARDPGLAQLERTLLNNPEMAAPLQQRFIAQRAARSGAIQDVAGTDDYYEAIKQGRKIFAKEDYAKALATGIDQDMAKALKPQIDSLMGRPSIEQAKAVAVRLARESDQDLSNFGSVEGMDWLKKALDNQISKASQPGSAIGKAELRALTQTKDDLMKVLGQIAPGYKAANEAYEAMSRQINSMDVARSLAEKLQKPGSEYAQGSAKEMGDAYMRALSEAKESVKKATGMNRYLSDVMSTRDIYALENLARDIGRKQFAETAGRATGSNTAQNLVSQNMLRRMLGPTGLPQSWAENTMLGTLFRPVQFAGKLAEPRIQNRLAELLLDPQQAAAVLAMQRALPVSSRVGAAVQPYLPGMAQNPLLALTANRTQ